MYGKALFRFGAGIFVLIVILTTLIEMGPGNRVKPEKDNAVSVNAAPDNKSNPLRADLLRCQALGEAAVNNANCFEVWATSRRRFLTPHSPQDRSE